MYYHLLVYDDSLSERDFLNNYCSINKNEEIRQLNNMFMTHMHDVIDMTHTYYVIYY